MSKKITMDSPARDWILEAAANDRQALLDGIMGIYNCREADVDGDGDIWIAAPQRGHWLGQDELDSIGRALKHGDI